MVTGKHPLWDRSKSDKENKRNMVERQFPKLNQLGDLDNFIYRLVQKEPYKRFRSPSMARKILSKYN